MCGNHLSRPPADLSYQLQAGFKTQTTSGSGAQWLAGAHNFILRKCLGTRQRTVSQTLSLFSGVSARSGRELTNSMGKISMLYICTGRVFLRFRPAEGAVR